MSRNPVMTEQELTAMHARAEKAGMYPYGASPEQMHTVARRDVNAPELTTAGNECGNSSVLIRCWSCSQKELKMEEDRSAMHNGVAKCTFIFYERILCRVMYVANGFLCQLKVDVVLVAKERNVIFCPLTHPED